jgi:CubicO group peptidase (beta-lactamase class C family)
MRTSLLFLCLFLATICQSLKSQSLYFPPISGSAPWDTLSPSALGWCTDEIDSLYSFLESENTKGFIVLKDGKIVLEKYFGTFTQDSLWYWASAGKTITSFLVGKAQEENFLSIHDPSSMYLGAGWTNCTPEQEDKIKIWNQLTMTSGLDDGVPDNHCTIDTCLICLADPGTRWAYHNAPYTLLEQVLEVSTGQGINIYTQAKLGSKTGIYGAWFTIDNDNIFFSRVRNMARFGLLFQNNCIWKTDTLLTDTAYVHQMTNTSQSLNLSYGYLWWLNGKDSYRLPTLQFVFPGPIAPHAPDDMFAGIGKNGQIVSIARSKGLVVVRMGNQTNSGEVSTLLLDQIWQHLNAVMCNSTAVQETSKAEKNLTVFPNPSSSSITINLPSTSDFQVEISNLLGERVMSAINQNNLDIHELAIGLYMLTVKQGGNVFTMKILKTD